MKMLAVHPGPLMYTRIFLRLEPLGLELVAQAARRAGHEVRILDLQVEKEGDFYRMVTEWQPDVVAFSCNYLANVPEIIDLAKAVKLRGRGKNLIELLDVAVVHQVEVELDGFGQFLRLRLHEGAPSPFWTLRIDHQHFMCIEVSGQ